MQSKQLKICNGLLCNGKFHTLDNFYIKNKLKNTYNYECKKCECYKKQLKYKSMTPTEIDNYKIKNKLKYNPIKQKEYEKARKHKKRIYHYKTKYNLSENDLLTLYENNNKKCYILNEYFDIQDLVVDHCHQNNKVRGLLNKHINIALGLFKDNITFLENSILYLKNDIQQKQINQIINKNISKFNIINNNWSQEEIRKNIRLKSKYKISLYDYYDILKLQNFKCAITNNIKTNGNGKPNWLHVDHCHISNQIRGLLTYEVNQGLGLFKDNIKTITNSIIYLKSFN